MRDRLLMPILLPSLLLLLLLLAVGSQGVLATHTHRDIYVDGDDSLPPCHPNPQHCDGESLSLIPVGEPRVYQVSGWWKLEGDFSPSQPSSSSDSRTLKTRPTTLIGVGSLTRVSQCTLKITLSNVSFSDWPHETTARGDTETWVNVERGDVKAVCGREPVLSQHDIHLHSLARSIATAAINSVPDLGPSAVTVTERDHHGQCSTQYQLGRVWPAGHEVVKTRNLAECTHSKPHSTPLSALITNATWSCHQQYNVDSERLAHPEGWLSLHSVSCHEEVTLQNAATVFSSLTLTPLDLSYPHTTTPEQDEGLLHSLDLNSSGGTSPSLDDQNVQIYDTLGELCTQLEAGVTAHTTILYPRLISALSHLPKEMLVQLYHEVSAGRICPQHQRLRDLFSAAVRDTTTPAAAAAKCQLMTSRTVEFSRSWTASLAAVKEPTAEALLSCAELLSGAEWEGAVLGVAAMAGWAARRVCPATITSHHPCHLDHFQCPQGSVSERCQVGEAVNVIVSHLSGWLARCISPQSQSQVLVALHGLGNVGGFGPDVESGLRLCAGNYPSIPSSVRVTAMAVLGRGPCSHQIQNWLKWEVLNETNEVEVRITAFQSLRQCSPDEAEIVATLVTQRQSHAQVKSYLYDFVKEEKDWDDGTEESKTKRDVRQFSHHLLTNLTTMFGLPDTILETDIIFQNSFLPRSLALNFTSPLLSVFGGSAQAGIRLENLEELIQSIFGPGGMAGEGLGAWLAGLVSKASQLFTSISQEFVQSHNRHKRSRSPSDLAHLLARVRHQVVTELKGWVWAGMAGQDGYFSPFSVDPLALDWHDKITGWLEHILDSTYLALYDSDAEVTSGWAAVNEHVRVCNLVGVPVVLWRRAGGLATLAATSQVNLLRFLTNPTASTINIGLKFSGGMYHQYGLDVETLPGTVSASTTTQEDVAGEASTEVVIRGGDQVQVKVDLPQASLLNTLVVHTLDMPPDYSAVDNGDWNGHQSYIPVIDEECGTDTSDDHLMLTSMREKDPSVHSSRSAVNCNEALETTLGLKVVNSKWKITGQHTVGLGNQLRISKSQGVEGYKLAMSWKNPGANSVFMDIQFEAEETGGQDGRTQTERRAGIVFGLTYSPHFTIKIELHSHQLSAFAEASFVNDPNLKRVEVHLGYLNNLYGFKGELLLVQDGGHVTIKPRIVLAYPGRQEDALMEGYLARYHSDKVSSITLDLYTEGSLKERLDLAIKGTAEMRKTLTGATLVTLKNVHVATPTTTLGLEAALSIRTDGIECKVQVTWGGEVVVLDGRVMVDESDYQLSVEILLPSHPHLDTRLLCVTHSLPYLISNNLTLMIGPESTRREFQVTHSTAWQISNMDGVLTSDIMATQRSQFTFKVDNKLAITSAAASIDWQFDHSLEVNNRALENLVTVHLDDTSHVISANFYDQSEDLLKYHVELELTLGPHWHFSYLDTLEQIREGEWVGHSYTQMPSSRQYTTTSTLAMHSLGHDDFLVESRQEMQVMETEGEHSWTIIAEESVLWTATNVSLQANFYIENDNIFGIEASMENLVSSQLDLRLRSWARNLFECQVVLGNNGIATDLSFSLLIIPLNKEIKSTVAVGHDQCSGGTVDGQLAWGARDDPTHTLALSSSLQLPQDSHPLQLRGSLSLFGLMWDARLEAELGDILEDTHRLTFTFTLPDQSRFEMGSLLDIYAGEDELNLLSIFHLHLPAGENHNVTLRAGSIQQQTLTEARLELHVDSPISQKINFDVKFKRQMMAHRSNLNFTLLSHSEANYWKPIQAVAAGWWNRSNAAAEAGVHWGNLTLEIEGSGWHRKVEGEHEVEIEGMIRRPMAASWKQLKATVSGSFSMDHNPARLKVSQDISVERDETEVFKSSGEVKVNVPQVEGRLTLIHSGNMATRQMYKLDGMLTGREMEVRVVGSVNGEPVRVAIHYEDGRRARVQASYRSPRHFTITFTTHLRDISIGFRNGGGTTYSLNTEGELTYNGHSTKMIHQLSISRIQASSNFTLDPLLGNVFKLNMTRTKLDLNEWETEVDLSWGERTFSYHDKVRFPSIFDFTVMVEVDSPELYLHRVLALVEAGADDDIGQGFRVMLQKHNITMHNARIRFYKYESAGENVWEAGVRDVVVYSHSYQDVSLHHTFVPLTAGLQVKSNMTLGDTPVLAVGMKIADDTRELILGLCSTSDECIRLHVHIYALATLSTRTFTLNAHALNSLFWKSPEDPLIQNSVTLVAQHTPDRTVVSGGILRVECAEVNCISSIPQNMLHATLQLTHDSLDLTVNTTKRTIVLTSLVRESQEGELLPTSLPGGRLRRTLTLESYLWLDREGDPEGVLTWTSSMATYASARAAERVFISSLTHPSITKPAVMRGRMQIRPSLTAVRLMFDVFSQPQDTLVLHLALKQHSAKYFFSGNLSKAGGSREHLGGMDVTVLPSPDNGEIGVSLMLPPKTPSFLVTQSEPQLQFNLNCKMVTKLANKTLSCKAQTATVNEEMSVGYQGGNGDHCWCGGVWLALLNRTFTLHHRSCRDPPNTQTALTKRDKGASKEELALKFGLVNPHHAEVDLLGSAGVNVHLHPPFLLHATAHHTRSLGEQWQYVILKAGEEIDSLTTSAKMVVQAVVSDTKKVKGFSSISTRTQTTSLSRYLRHHARLLTHEAMQDQLMADLILGANACVTITSLLWEGMVAYVSHNYAPTLSRYIEGTRMLMESIVMNTGATVVQLCAHLHHTTRATLNIIVHLPATILKQASSLPLFSGSYEWMVEHLRFLQQSAAYTFLRNTTIKTIKFLQTILAWIYNEEIGMKQNIKNEEAWNIWVPLLECSHSLPEVWQMIQGDTGFTQHTQYLTSTLLHWWHLFTHPLTLINTITPPFPGEGAIIGDKNFVSVDGRTFNLTPTSNCSRVLLTDSRDKLFTLVANWDQARAGMAYKLLLANKVVGIQPDLQVTINKRAISLPYTSETLTVLRDDRRLSVVAQDNLGRELVSMVCWTGARRTCVVGVSGWLHGDTRALLGTLNLDPANDFMRPSGKITQSKTVFKKSWQVGSGCRVAEESQPAPQPSTRTVQLCKRFFLHYTSPVMACHESVNIRPYYDTCLRYLASLESTIERTEHDTTASNVDRRYSESIIGGSPPVSTSSADWNADEGDIDSYDNNGTVYEVSIQDVLLKLTESMDILEDLSSVEGGALCDVAAAYSTVCTRHQVVVPLPPLCDNGVVPSYHEPLSVEPQLDVVVLVSEDTCDTFTYNHLVRPLPQVLSRVARAKSISDIQIGVLGYGSGGGDIVYRSHGNSLLMPASQLRITRPPEDQRSQASLMQAMRAVSTFPFRPGSVRVALLLRCDARDIPKFTETLSDEMERRRLALFTLTPDTLMFNPSHPEAVRNTIGIDRWRVYNLKLDKTHSSDSWGVRHPSSNIAQLAMKSGGGVFSMSEIRQDPRARYYMKLFRRVLSKAIVKVVLGTYQQHQ
ncbi:hypothetical protein Pcinc_002206 [Petrolisthes cinctipes]|uniref:Vitellogenin domain-containing protein n=1 Tax=Petrolisthes cinctipes TaxID=88211 RepID=A0AAE1GLV4_PETCI|nr:hypothetical protein Pcinc_002206 [Petrolisthes cinctipes]